MNGRVNFAGGESVTLGLTSVCAQCHSQGGPYNGVDSVGESVGAKDNWGTGGVYQDGSTLKAGKEKWCVGCHDDAPPTINGGTAPTVGGDNLNYGFFTSGHGLDSGSQYDKYALGDGAGNQGASKNCTDCHDLAWTHLNGIDDTNTAGQRLRSTVNTTSTGGTVMGVCKACHTSSAGTPSNVQVSTHGNDESDGYNKIEDSFVIACPQCHEVHGNNINGDGNRNIKLIRADVRISDDTTGNVVLTNSTSTDSFDEPDTIGVDDNDDLCATCHTNAANQGYPMARHPGGNHTGIGGMGADERGNRCPDCHTHDWAEDGNVEANDGFMPSCSGCHTYPPGGAQGTYQGSKTHNIHVGTYDFACSTCHYVWPTDHNESGVTSKNNWSAKFNPDNVDVVFDPAKNPDGTTTINYAGINRNRQCNDLYCHGQSGTINGQPISSLGGLNLSTNTPTWDYAFNPDAFARYEATKDTGACGTCHDTTKDNQAQGGTGWAT